MGSRRGRTGYLIFANERRLEVLNQLKEQRRGSQKFAIAEVSKELGRLWNELSEEQREEYKSKAASSKVPLFAFTFNTVVPAGAIRAQKHGRVS